MNVSTPLVVLLLGFIGAATAIILYGRDPSPLITLIGTIISALLYAEVRAIKSQTEAIQGQTNGNTSKMLSIVDKAIPGNASPVQDGQSTQDSERKA